MKKKFALPLSSFCVICLGIFYFGGWKHTVLDIVVIVMLAMSFFNIAYPFLTRENKREMEEGRLKKEVKNPCIVQRKASCVAEGEDENITVDIHVIVSRRPEAGNDIKIVEDVHAPDSVKNISLKADKGVAGKERKDRPDQNDEKQSRLAKNNVNQILLNPTRDTLEAGYLSNFVFTSVDNGVQRFKLVQGKYVYPKDEYIGKPVKDMRMDLDRQKITEVFVFPNEEKQKCIIKNIVPAEVKKINSYDYELSRFGKIEIEEKGGY